MKSRKRARPHAGEELRCIEQKLASLSKLGAKIMSKISDFSAAQNAFNDQIDAAVSGLSDDIAALNAQIAKLQSTSGAITPEDQALLDGLQARGKATADKVAALDALTPPALPAA